MALPEYINIGPAPNDGLGDPIRTAFGKSNEWFLFLNSKAQPNPPVTLVGRPGDQAGYYAYDSTFFYYCFADYDGSSVIWAQLTQLGNIGNIQNGNSFISINRSGANATVTIAGTSNVVVFANTGQYTTGTISATGNIAGNYILGNGSQLTGLPAGYSNSNVASYLPVYSGNLVSLGGPIITTGNATASAFLTTGFVSATGNVTGEYFFGNGAFLTGVTGSGGNGTAIVNGLSKIEIPDNSGNIDVTVGFSSNIAVFTNNGIEINGELLSNSVSVTNTFSATGNVTGGNLRTSGSVSATGNVTGGYIIGDGSLLTNVGGAGNYGNADVAAYLPTYTGNIASGNLSVSGQANITGNVNVNYQSRINGTVDGQLYGLTNGVNTAYGTWDFGFIAANTYANPIQWIFAQTAAGNVDMGNITAPASLNIDIGPIF